MSKFLTDNMSDKEALVVGSIVLALISLVAVCYVNNVLDFVDCDFQAPYKCEIVHGVGVVLPPVSVVTTFVGTDI